MTKISFTDEHLRTIMVALEVYSRLRSGQIKIAMDNAFADYDLSYEESLSIEKFVRSIIFPEPPRLESDGHGGYHDQYGCTYDEDGIRDSEITWEEKARAKRPNLSSSAYFGVGCKEVKGGSLAYEIYSTIRQYTALKENDGYTGNTVSFHNPSKVTEIPLPIIEGFSTEKKFPIKGKAIIEQINKAEEAKDYKKAWQIVDDYCKRRYPELKSYTSAKIDKEGSSYVLVVSGARRD